MIKRRFYKMDHGDRDAPSESSSSSDSEVEAEATEDEEEDEEEEGDEGVAQVIEKNVPSSGYESEDSSANEVNIDSSGLPTSDEDNATTNDSKFGSETHLSGKGIEEIDDIQHDAMPKKDDIPRDALQYALKYKSVFKCRLCPRIVCLSEETLIAHLKSKRHARSVKLLKEGRLKLMLTEDGNLEGDIHIEEHAPIEQENSSTSKKKIKGLKGERNGERKGKRFKKKSDELLPMEENAIESTKSLAKKRRKHNN